jgi:hypothetical protein
MTADLVVSGHTDRNIAAFSIDRFKTSNVETRRDRAS